jgi:hypothetical protein
VAVKFQTKIEDGESRMEDGRESPKIEDGESRMEDGRESPDRRLRKDGSRMNRGSTIEDGGWQEGKTLISD